MTLIELKDFLNKLLFGDSIYPHMFEVHRYRDLVIIGVFEDETDNGENILKYSVDLEKNNNGNFIICNIHLTVFVVFQKEVEDYLNLFNWFLHCQEFFDSEMNTVGSVQLDLFNN